MDCREFEERIDQYLDTVLPTSQMTAASDHVRGCKGCNDLITSYQHASALLRAAVADKAAAVDVSGLWNSIEARLDAGSDAVLPERGRESQPARHSWLHGLDLGGRVRDLVIGVLGPAPLRAGAFAAAAAAVALFVIAGGPGIGEKMSGGVTAKLAADEAAEPATVLSHHDIDAKPRAKHVRIDNLDIAPGKSVATWAKPRTRTQVIWVNGPDDEFGVSNATHPR